MKDYEEMIKDRGPWITLINGEPFHYQVIDVAAIDPEVIAHALSNLCRFTGHVKDFYSVAQHCVVVSRLVPPELALTGLLHDAAEAFTGDVNKPLKDLLGDRFKHIEENVECAIAGRFGLEFPFPPEIKQADLVAFSTEVRDVAPSSNRYPHEVSYDPLPDPIYAWGPHTARREWMNRFVELGGQ